MRRYRQRTAKADAPARDEGATLALLAEAEILELDNHGDGEAVIELGDIDIGRRQPALSEGGTAGLDRAGLGDALVFPNMAVTHPVSGAEPVDRRASQIAGGRAARDDRRGGAVRDNGAVE